MSPHKHKSWSYRHRIHETRHAKTYICMYVMHKKIFVSDINTHMHKHTHTVRAEHLHGNPHHTGGRRCHTSRFTMETLPLDEEMCVLMCLCSCVFLCIQRYGGVYACSRRVGLCSGVFTASWHIPLITPHTRVHAQPSRSQNVARNMLHWHNLFAYKPRCDKCC